MKKVAVSACLLGNECRYDATGRYDKELLELLKDYEIVAFCPEDYCFGSPRPTMDLIDYGDRVDAISNLSGANLSPCIREYAKAFFHNHQDLNLFIGKDRSPSCGVCNAKVFDKDKVLLSEQGTGLMAKEAIEQGIESYGAEEFVLKFGNGG